MISWPGTASLAPDWISHGRVIAFGGQTYALFIPGQEKGMGYDSKEQLLAGDGTLKRL